MEVPVVKAQKPKEHKVNEETLAFTGRNPANIPSLRKKTSGKPHRKLKVKTMPDVQPALEQLFEKEDTSQLVVPPPPREVNEAQRMEQQVMDLLNRTKTKKSPRLSELI